MFFGWTIHLTWRWISYFNVSEFNVTRVNAEIKILLRKIACPNADEIHAILETQVRLKKINTLKKNCATI